MGESTKSMKYCYLDKANKEIGPLSLNTLAKLRFAGVIDGDTPVRNSESTEWKTCRDIIADTPTSQANTSSLLTTKISPTIISRFEGKKLSKRQKGLLMALIGAALIICGAFAGYKSIVAKTTLIYKFSLDGKEYTTGQAPDVKVDEQVFVSGGHLKPGRHRISVHQENIETYERSFWVFYGTKDFGNLPLETCKGSLLVEVNPSPATVIVQREGGMVFQGSAPLSKDKLAVGDYILKIQRGEYEETRSVQIKSAQQTKTQVDLNLGSVDLSSEPSDAEFEVSGNGRHWQGKLPVKIDDVPCATYSLAVTRKGWKLDSVILISLGNVKVCKTEYPYGSISVTSEPTGLIVFTNGVEIGKTPLTLQELKPGQYTLTASDGENDLMADISVAPKEAAQHAFVFRYGTVALSSKPPGATVIRKGKEIGKTPLTLNHIPVGKSSVLLQLEGYASTNFIFGASEGVTANCSVKLFSKRYLDALKQAHTALDASRFELSKRLIVIALESEPNDPAAIALQKEVSKAVAKEEAERITKQRGEIIAVIEKAIEASGGRDVLMRFKAMKSSWNFSGTDARGNTYLMHVEEYIQSPDKVRHNETISYPQTTRSANVLGLNLSIQSPTSGSRKSVCLDGSSSWAVDNSLLGSFKKVTPDGLAVLNAELYRWWLSRLFPLLNNAQFRLSMLTGISSAPDNSVSVGVQADGHPDAVLFFDKTSGFLVGIQTMENMSGQTFSDVEYFSNFIAVSGLKSPTAMEYKKDGVTISRGKCVWFLPCEDIPAEVFYRPNQ